MKKWLILTILSFALPINSYAINLDNYITQTGSYASQIDGAYYDPISFDQYIGGSGGQDLTANAFQFTISQPLTINHLSIDAVVENTGSNTTQTLPLTFQIYNGTSTGAEGLGVAPNLNSLVLSSKSTTFSSNGTNNNVYTDKNIHFKTTLQPGTYWFADEITPPQTGGATVDVQSIDFMGKVATPETATWIFFSFMLLLIYLRGYYSKEM